MSSAEETFDKVVDYIQAELAVSFKDYEFITEFNKATANTFQDYMTVADKIAKNVNRINENQQARARLEGLVKAVDEIDAKVTSLETLAYKIDAYSRRLEDSFKKLESS